MRLAGFPSLLPILTLSILSPTVAMAQLAPYEVMHTLTGDEGAFSQSGLVRGADNRLYGVATDGGAGGLGTIFRITTGGTFEVVHTFLATTPEGARSPVSLIRGRDKNLYGTTDYGGPAGDGVIYRLNWIEASQTYSGVDVIHAFDCSQGDGGDPWGSLIEGTDGALYGVTNPSWAPDPACSALGTVFKVNKDGTGFAVLATFDYLVTGSYQFGPLAFGSDGSIFGTLTDSANPAFAFGSVFKIAPNGTVTYPKVFGGTDGAYPFSGLVRGVDGAFYGTTYGGGANEVGTLFRIDESGNFTSLYSFESGSINTPYSPLVVGGDGMLYGAAHAGGASGFGGTYTFDPPAPIGSGGGFTLHSTFDDATTGSSPWGPLGVGPAPQRHLYGTQGSGGSTGQGTLFGLLDIQVVNRPPVPAVMASPNPAESQGAAGATVLLSALGTSDADFDDLIYSWTLPPEATDVVEAPDSSTISATYPTGTWQVTLTVNDGTVERSINVSVTVSRLIVPTNITVEATGASGAVVSYSVSGSSSTGVPVEPICSHANNSLFPIGVTTVNCSFIDPDTNIEIVASFDVTVEDTTGPDIAMDINGIEVNSQGAFGALVPYDNPLIVGPLDSPSASDLVDGVVPVVCNPPPGVFPLGRTVVNCTAVDAAGNTSTFKFDVVVRDSDDPVLTLPGPISVSAQTAAGAVVTYTVSATDVTSPVGVTVTCTPASGTMFVIGVTTVTCVATDSAARTTTGSFVVTVSDTTPPVLSLPSTITVQATGPAGAAATYSASASDNVLVTSFSCDRASGSTFVLGATVVQCTATDAAGNKTSGTFTVNVVDTVGPVISVPANIVVTATGSINVSYPAATAIDLVSGPRPVSCTPVSGSVFEVGVTTVTCVSSDARGISTSKSFTVTVVTTPPTLKVTLTPGVLWPPNHKMETITATIVATSEAGPVVVTLVGITSNEPDNGLGDGDTVNDVQYAGYGTDDRTFQVRAERSGKGTGRVYTVTYRVVLQSHPTIYTETKATVTVPHDMRDKKK